MRYLFLLMLAGALALSGCQSALTAKKDSTPTPTPAPNQPARPDDGAPRITLADAKAEFDKGGAVFIDTRPEETYKQEHVKGAINITLMDDASKYDKIPKGRKVIAYCS
jgi:3-mercaptopyruvate sulfurtransferase SseA